MLSATVRAAAEYLEDGDEPATPEAIYAYLKAKFADFDLATAPSVVAVKSAVELLTSPNVAIFVPVGDGLRMHMNAEAGLRRLTVALGSAAS